VTFIIAIHVFICLFLIGVILLQPGKSDGGMTFGSSSQSIFGSKGAGNFLTKTTSVFAIIFLLTSFILTRSRIQEYTKSVVPLTSEKIEAPKTEAPKK
jgi:preprotein translocase subunit SecG